LIGNGNRPAIEKLISKDSAIRNPHFSSPSVLRWRTKGVDILRQIESAKPAFG